MYYKGTIKKIHNCGRYIMKDTNPRKLDENMFRFRQSMSDAEETVYEHVFPVYRYHAAVTLEARFMLIKETGEIKIDVFDSGTKGIYGPWYNDESGIHEKIIGIINSNIAKEMKRLNIFEEKENRNG